MRSVAPERRRRRRRRALAALVLGLAVVAVGGWLGVRGALAASELRQVQAAAPDVRAALDQRDVGHLRDALAPIAEHATRASDLTSDPLWSFVSALPWVGENARAVHVAARGLSDVTASLDAVLATPGLDEVVGHGDVGAVPRVLEAAAPALRLAATRASDAAGEAGGVDRSALVPPIRDAVSELSDVLSPAATSLSTAADTAQWLPSMLGTRGPRDILVAVQNTAEVRAGGGLTGTFLLLRVDDGRMQLVEHADSSAFAATRSPVAELPASLEQMYGDVVGTYVQNATMTSDFDASARLMSAWWQQHTGDVPDAVIAVDPVVLQSLLEATGPVALPTGASIDAAGFIDSILVAPYLDSSSDDQTGLQRAAVSAVVSRAVSGDLDLATALSGIGRAVSEGRISVWSAHEGEQRFLQTGPLAGIRARQLDGDDDTFAVLVNDATTGKLDSYLEMSVGATTASCRPDGRSDVVVEVQLRNVAPPDARGYPESMTGQFNPAAPGDLVTDVAVAAPPGWFFGAVESAGAVVPSRQVVDGELPTSLGRLTLAPGASGTLRFHFVAPTSDPVDPQLIHTPLLREVVTTVPEGTCA